MSLSPPSSSFTNPFEEESSTPAIAETALPRTEPPQTPPEAPQVENGLSPTDDLAETETKAAPSKVSVGSLRVEFFCFLAAGFFCAGKAINYLAFGMQRDKKHWDLAGYKAMEGTAIRNAFHMRRHAIELHHFSEFITCAAWLLFSIPMAQLAFVMSNGGKRHLWLHSLMATLAFGGAMSKFAAALMQIGLWMSANFMAKKFELKFWNPMDGTSVDNDLGWKSLEVMYRVAQGAASWVNGFEHLWLCGVLVLYFLSVRTLPSRVYRAFGIGLSWLGLLVGLTNLAEFDVILLRLEGFKGNNIHEALLYLSIIQGVILLPLWLFVMSCRLPYAIKVTEECFNAE